MREPGIPRLVAGIFTAPARMHISNLHRSAANACIKSETCIRGGAVKIQATKRGILDSIPAMNSSHGSHHILSMTSIRFEMVYFYP